MYHAHWGLERTPFAAGIDPTAYYEGAPQAEALARLRFFVHERRHAGILLGDRGAGKSLLLTMFARERRAAGQTPIELNLAGLSTGELLWQLASQLAIGPRVGEDAPRLYRRITDWVAARPVDEPPIVLLADDADQAGPDALAQLVRLGRLAPRAGRPWLAVVFAAARARAGRLGEALLEAIDLRIDLEPWDDDDAAGYVQFALLEAGCERPLFDDEALSVLHTLSGGNPRRLNRLADYALLGAAATGLDQVDAGTVEAAHDALGWSTAA
ncbi:MAG: AAA family ATPase [Pirellulales bacterium]|nr:AAA family ATPase [Pirellulales bacterium]